MFDIDDLTEETLCILCKEFGSKLKMFVWRGFEVHGGEGVKIIIYIIQIEQEYLDQILANYFKNQ